MSFADWLMKRAISHPPAGREDWAQAMAAEYETLEAGKLSWALGCWAKVFGWRLRADRLYLMMLFGAAALITSGVLDLLIAMSVPREIMRSGLYPSLVIFAAASCAFAVYRPDRVFTTAIILLAIEHVGSTLLYFFLFGAWGWGAAGFTIHDAPPLVGITSDVGACLIGATLGLALRNRRPAIGA